MAKMTNEQLVSVLCESEWFLRLCEEWKNHDVPDPAVSLRSWVDGRWSWKTFAGWARPYAEEMVSLIRGIESDGPWGSADHCVICSGLNALNVSTPFNPKNIHQPFDKRDLYVCLPCYKTAQTVMPRFGLKGNGEVWTEEQMAKFVMAAHSDWLHRQPKAAESPKSKPSWDAYLAQERDIAACQKVIDRDAYLRASLDRPVVKSKTLLPLVSGDLLGNPWNRKG